MTYRRLLAFAVATTASLLNTLSYAGAFQLYELGAPIIGTAAVGQAVVATDASVAYFNPAAMTLISDTEFMLGSQVVMTYTNFSPNHSNTIHGNNGANAGGVLPGLDAYFVYSYSPKLKFGISFTSPYGGSLTYNDHWVGRYNVQQMIFYTLNLNPTIAYQVNDWLSIGGGLAIEYANIYQTVAIPVPVSPSIVADGQVTVKADNTSPGGNLGILLTPTSKTQVGIAYRTQIIHNLRGEVGFLNFSMTPSASTKLIMPSNVIVSLSQVLSPQTTLLGELGWANWSSMVNNVVTVDGLSAVTPQHWHDTYRIGLGGRYQYNPVLLLQAGASYDSSPTTSSKRLPDLPMDRQIRLAAGLQYALIKAVMLGLSYEYINFGNADINNVSSNGVLSGSYSRNFASVLQASLNVSF